MTVPFGKSLGPVQYNKLNMDFNVKSLKIVILIVFVTNAFSTTLNYTKALIIRDCTLLRQYYIKTIITCDIRVLKNS